jgi:hypothetical protein
LKKGDSQRLLLQNAQLYLWGTVLSWLLLQVTAAVVGRPILWMEWLYEANHLRHLVLVAVHTISGMLVGALIKFEDNMAKVHCVAVAMIIETASSSAMSLTLPTIQLVSGTPQEELISPVYLLTFARLFRHDYCRYVAIHLLPLRISDQ